MRIKVLQKGEIWEEENVIIKKMEKQICDQEESRKQNVLDGRHWDEGKRDMEENRKTNV